MQADVIKLLARFAKDQTGGGATEYGMIAALVAVAVLHAARDLLRLLFRRRAKPASGSAG